jgi:uncharacterized membrane protein|tara:strand:+ start:8289 stop:8672 length:384 start_codon:yes stop_codon:yes gene_type:complete
MNITNLIISSILLLSVDSLYLSFIKDFFKKQIEKVQKSSFQINIYGAVLSYLFLIIGINYFIIQPRRSYVDAFLLGLVIYGVYEGTTYALLKDWNINTVVIDTLWGGILFTLVTYLTYLLSYQINNI